MSGTTVFVAVHVAIELALIVRVMLRPHREPAARVAWVAVITVLPVVGIWRTFSSVRSTSAVDAWPAIEKCSSACPIWPTVRRG